jgi:hypothetical protein
MSYLVSPQLPLGAETIRSLQDAKQYRCPDRADRGNLAELFPSLVFLGLCQQLPPHFLTHRAQRIELLVVKLRPPAHSQFADLPEPLCTMAHAKPDISNNVGPVKSFLSTLRRSLR